MSCRTKISEFCVCTVTVIAPKWALLCALPSKHFFLCISFSVPNLKNYNLISPPSPAEVCDRDFGLRTDHTLGASRKCPFFREGTFPLQCGFWGVPWLSGELPFLSSKGIMEELLCVVTEEFSWTPTDRPLTRVEGTKPHSAVVLIC